MKNILLIAIALSLVSVALCDYESAFYLSFEGKVVGNTTGVARAKALSQQTTSLVDNTYGLTYSEKKYIGATALWVSQYDTTKGTEVGNITFGISGPSSPVHVITFELISAKQIDSWHGYLHGAGYINVTGGQGAFAGTDGILSFTQTTNTTSGMFIRHVGGSLWIQGNPPPPPTDN